MHGKLWDSFLSNLKEGDGPVTVKKSGKFMLSCMFWWLASETATIISNPMHKNFVNFSRHIEYYIAFPWPWAVWTADISVAFEKKKKNKYIV